MESNNENPNQYQLPPEYAAMIAEGNAKRARGLNVSELGIIKDEHNDDKSGDAERFKKPAGQIAVATEGQVNPIDDQPRDENGRVILGWRAKKERDLPGAPVPVESDRPDYGGQGRSAAAQRIMRAEDQAFVRRNRNR